MSRKLEKWIYDHIKHPERITDFDRQWIGLVAKTVPNIVGTLLTFSILSFVYFWIYNKYGIERVIILFGIQMIMMVAELRKAMSL